ncbi:TonB-dependent receptor [candidate division KSB1 bacterium]|nr:TonB-dependent receptor [candidate division KSB1 bacterium]
MRLKVLILLTALLALFTSVFAGTTGKLIGKIVAKNTGDPVVGANVIIDGTQMGALTDIDGYFFILNIPPGTYSVTARHIGYRATTITNVYIRVDHTTEISYALEEQVLEGESIVVRAERPEVQRDVTSTVVNVSSEEIDTLPINTIGELLQLQAGVVSSGGLHIRGGRSGELAYLIDGHRIEDPLFGGNATDINNEAIQQMELITGTFNAEYGNAMSGVVNIVTKENTARVRGRIRAKTTHLGIDEANDNLNEKYLEGNISGPLWPGSPIGFLLSGKMVDGDNYYQSGTLIEENGIIRPSGQYSGNAFGYDKMGSFFGKVFFNPFAKAKLSLSFNFNDREWQNYSHSYKYIPDSSYIRKSNSNLLALNFTHTLSNRFFYEIRLSQYHYEYLRNYGGHHYTGYSSGSGKRWDGEFYLTASNEEYIDEKVGTLSGKIDATYQYNRYNLFKAGMEIKYQDLDYFWIYGPKRLPDNQYINDFHKFPYEGAIYLQDKIEFESIVLNAGLRFDFYHPRVTYIADPNNREESVTEANLKKQLSPRLGVAYPVTDNTVFHFAYGQFFQRPTFEVLYEDLSRNMDVNKPLIGNPDLAPQSTSSYELGLNTTLSTNATMQTTVFSKKIRDLIGVAWQFKVPGVPLQYAYYVNEDFAYVKGLELNLKWRLLNVSTRLNYTYSIAEGSSSSQQERFSGAYDVKGRQSLQFYPLSFDRRHMFNANVTVNFRASQGPFGWLPKVFQRSYYSFIVQYGSGLPYTYNPTRKRYETDQNNARMPYTLFVDMEVEKRFMVGKFEFGLFCQVYNLLDRKNVRSVYSATGTPDDFGPFEQYSKEYMADPTNYFAPRTVYLGVSVGI